MKLCMDLPFRLIREGLFFDHCSIAVPFGVSSVGLVGNIQEIAISVARESRIMSARSVY